MSFNDILFYFMDFTLFLNVVEIRNSQIDIL